MEMRNWYKPDRRYYLEDFKRAFSLRDFEPQMWRDWALIPYWIARFVFAWCWAESRYPLWRFHSWLTVQFNFRTRLLPSWGGRHVDVDPVACPRCLWAGPRRWVTHTYTSIDEYDVEAVDECPRCGMEI